MDVRERERDWGKIEGVESERVRGDIRWKFRKGRGEIRRKI